MPSAAPKKRAAKSAPAPPVESPVNLAGLVDELGALEAELAPISSKLKRVETLRSLLRAEFADRPAAESFRVHGAQYEAMLGPKGNQTIVNREAAHRVLGWRQYVNVSTVSLKALEGCGAALGSLVSTEMTGPRSLLVISSPAPAVKRGK